MNFHSVKLSAQRTITTEIDGLNQLFESVGDEVGDAVSLISKCKGRVICAGVGKSGHVAKKITATLVSTGTLAQYLHPAEASHGDLGMITKNDVVLALSKSGETKELADLTGYCLKFNVPLIAMTCNGDSTLAKTSTISLVLPNAVEACSETKAPTTSTTLMMVMGDVLAVALIESQSFTAQDFKIYHPGGSLGAALASVSDLMRSGADMPLVSETESVGEAVIEMSTKGFGCVGITSPEGELVGIITDGDLRRHMSSNLTDRLVSEIMTRAPRVVSGDRLASEVLTHMNMQDVKVTQMFVCDEKRKPVGLLHIHDLLKAGLA